MEVLQAQQNCKYAYGNQTWRRVLGTGDVRIMIKNCLTKIIILLLIAASIVCVAGVTLAADPTIPPIPDDPDATPIPTPPQIPGGGPTSGGGTVYTPPTPTPTPVPTSVPPNRLDTILPSQVTVGTVSVGIAGTQVTVPYGYLFNDVIKNGTLEAPIAVGDNAMGKLVITVDPSGSQSGTIRTMDLIANKTLVVGGQQIGVAMDISLSNLPPGSSFNFDLKPTDSVDMVAVNAQLAAYTDKKFSSTPLLVFEATKNGIQNGRDITGAKFTFTVPRPADFDPSADYYVIRQSDGMMEVLNATLVGSPDADPLTYEVVSPHGLSTFSMVKAESSTVAPTVAPTSAPSSTPASESPDGVGGYLVIIGAFVIGAASGMAVLTMFLWLRSR
jgi:hypothetical protein